jgi:hypothetical protein
VTAPTPSPEAIEAACRRRYGDDWEKVFRADRKLWHEEQQMEADLAAAYAIDMTAERERIAAAIGAHAEGRDDGPAGHRSAYVHAARIARQEPT